MIVQVDHCTVAGRPAFLISRPNGDAEIVKAGLYNGSDAWGQHERLIADLCETIIHLQEKEPTHA